MAGEYEEVTLPVVWPSLPQTIWVCCPPVPLLLILGFFSGCHGSKVGRPVDGWLDGWVSLIGSCCHRWATMDRSSAGSRTTLADARRMRIGHAVAQIWIRYVVGCCRWS
ncbi:hypothetical protein ACLOJK_006763 [Asimina triloba]